MKGFIDSIRKLGMVRVAMLVGVTLGIIGAFVWLEMQGPSRGRMTVLASDLDPQSAQQITAELTGRKIPYRLDGGQIFVPDGDLATARTLLSVSGLSSGNVTGYEIFDRGNNLAVTDFDQQVKLTRALEGELARTIVSVHGITHARVHIVLSRREPFAHDRQHAQASVMLTVPGRQVLSPEAVQSVVDLVAAGVPGLRPQDVTIVDSNLHLLSQAGDGNDARDQNGDGGGYPAKDRGPAVAGGRVDAGTQPRTRTRACRGVDPHELRQGERDAGEIRPGRVGGAQHAKRDVEQQDDGQDRSGLAAEQSAQCRCRRRHDRQPGGPAGRDDEL